MKTLAPSSVHLPLFLIKFCHSQKLNFLRTLPGENKQTSLLETLEKKIIKQITNYVWFLVSLWTLCAMLYFVPGSIPSTRDLRRFFLGSPL